ncbi:PKD domain-containing protein [Bacteroides nordii]|jgi:PKD|uniref:PKD domain-containing protein n=1 Tax=Bacteroides nordii TaxID=291645 RepID=A0A413VTX6_9BACE|nr:PKD domain-containing protein [Bacteroides nordii]OKZ05100.1 MAG: PKD domain-containing protein [Bacteroides sp. 41_26]RHB37060.1 PKD domain-containing protein [Bacteroides nordii]
MKYFKYILFIVTSLACYSCIENDPDIENFPNEKVAFSYEVIGDYKVDYLVGSTIQFTNTSAEVGACVWDFGDGTPKSTESNPQHKYESAGLYNVTLTIENVGKRVCNLLVSDIFPTVSMKEIDGICEVNKTFVELSVSLPNPENKEVEYQWIFPEGTVDENLVPVTTSNAENPGKLKFLNVGSQKIILKTKLGGRTLQEGVIKVPVGYMEDVKTIYYAVKKGNIQALKLVHDAPDNVKIYPFDLGVKSGQHPYNLLFSDSQLYVLDAGKQIGYIDDVDGNLGDGKISVISKDGASVETMLTNNQKTAFNDPHFGYIDENQKMLYYTDRNTGIRRLALSERNLLLDVTNSKYDYFVQNDKLGYYKNGYDYGAMNASFTKTSDGTWWWPKTFNNPGIFRFKDSDIGSSSVPSNGMTAGGLFIKSLAIDEQRQMVFLAVREGATSGIYAIPMSAIPNESAGQTALQNSIKNYLIKELVSDSEGSSGEYIDICQMVLDPEDGSVYFGYRADPTSSVKSGLMRCYPDGGTYKVETVIEGVEIYGVAINHKKSKLF